MSKRNLNMLLPSEEFRDRLQEVADNRLTTVTAVIVRALLETYPELRPLKSFDQTIGVPAAQKVMGEMKPEDTGVKVFNENFVEMGNDPKQINRLKPQAKFGAAKFEKKGKS